MIVSFGGEIPLRSGLGFVCLAFTRCFTKKTEVGFQTQITDLWASLAELPADICQ